MGSLSYWKARVIDARAAFRRNKTREYACAVRYAETKVAKLEKRAFEKTAK